MEGTDLSKLAIGADQRMAAVHGRRRRRVIAIGVAAVVLVGVVAFLAATGRLRSAVEVDTAKAAMMFPSRALTVLNASGYMVAQRKAAVSSKATGRLQKLYVEEGRKVKQEDVLAELENRDLLAALAEAKALHEVARAALDNALAEHVDAELNFNRQKSLREKGVISEQAFDAAEARYRKAVALVLQARFGIERAEAAVRVTEINLEYSLIRAPFDGVILTKSADIGEVVAPFGAAVNAKAAVATMADLASLMAEVDVSESGIEKVHVGAAAEVRLDAIPDDRFPGTVHMIVPTADRAKATVMAKVKLEKLDERILPEMSVKVAFLSRPLKDGENQPFLSLPVSAIRNKAGKDRVFLVQESRAKETPVTMGRNWGDVVEILSGIKEGAVVVLAPPEGLGDGHRVKVKE